MRILSALSLVFLLVGCGAATTRNTTPEEPTPPVTLTAGCLTVTAPAGWFVQDGPLTEEQDEYSSLAIVNGRGHEIAILHPHGSAEFAERTFLVIYMRAAILEAAAAQEPEVLREGVTSFTVSEQVEEANGIPNGYLYVITVTMDDGTSEVNHVLMMPLVPQDITSTILVSTTVPAGEGEIFPAVALQVARTLRYTPES